MVGSGLCQIASEGLRDTATLRCNRKSGSGLHLLPLSLSRDVV